MDRPLPPVRVDIPFPLVRAIQLRHSVRSFAQESLKPDEIGMILWSAQGIIDPAEGRRAAPSAGGIFPFEILAVLPDGLFRYLPQKHGLQPISGSDIRADLAKASLDQEFIAQAPFTVALIADRPKIAGRYGKRASRYSDMEAGHIAQNIHLMAVALGLGSVPVGAFDDGAVSRLLGLSSEFDPLYLIPVGKPA